MENKTLRDALGITFIHCGSQDYIIGSPFMESDSPNTINFQNHYVIRSQPLEFLEYHVSLGDFQLRQFLVNLSHTYGLDVYRQGKYLRSQTYLESHTQRQTTFRELCNSSNCVTPPSSEELSNGKLMQYLVAIFFNLIYYYYYYYHQHLTVN